MMPPLRRECLIYAKASTLDVLFAHLPTFLKDPAASVYGLGVS